MSKIIRTKQLLNSFETIRIHPKNPEFREREREREHSELKHAKTKMPELLTLGPLRLPVLDRADHCSLGLLSIPILGAVPCSNTINTWVHHTASSRSETSPRVQDADAWVCFRQQFLPPFCPLLIAWITVIQLRALRLAPSTWTRSSWTESIRRELK